MKPGSAIVILSTVGIDDIKNMYRMCKEKGIYLLDSGVSPGQLSDQNGLIALTGGDDEGIEMAMPVLQDWAKEVIHCGGKRRRDGGEAGPQHDYLRQLACHH